MSIMGKDKKINKIYGIICIILFLGMFLASVCTFVTQNIFCKRLHMDNAFVRTVLGDDKVDEIASTWVQQNHVVISWQEIYPFHDDMTVKETEDVVAQEQRWYAWTPYVNRYLQKWDHLTDSLSQYTGSLNMCYDELVRIGNGYDRIIGWNMVSNQTDGTLEIFRLNDGNYSYVTKEVGESDMEDIVTQTVELHSFLEEQGIDFLYVNAGDKICEEKDLIPEYIETYVSENQDEYMRRIADAGIDTMDMRALMHEDGIDHESAYFYTDPHWKNTTALWAAGKIADYANENYGFAFDEEHFSIENYDVRTYESAFMGTQGLALHLTAADKEDFETVYPQFETSFRVTIPSQGYEETGTYEDVFVNEDNLEVANRMYNAWHIRNDAFASIENLDAPDNSDKRILLIYDSFSWPLMTYLATDVGQIDAIHLGEFYGSVKSYVYQKKPDLVIVVYCGRNITPNDYYTRTSLFDFR